MDFTPRFQSTARPELPLVRLPGYRTFRLRDGIDWLLLGRALGQPIPKGRGLAALLGMN